jgi:UDP-N-acetyl-2-amino-2-deoxyglucuronate dehydrogenase
MNKEQAMSKKRDRFVKFAVVGLGNIGSRHLAVIDADPRARLVDICDIKTDRLKKYSGLYEVASHTNFTEMLRKTSADIINICTPHGLHAPMAVEASEAGKHMLVEKPMALTLEDTFRMDEAAMKNNVRLMVVWQNRHNIPIKLAKKALEDKALGQVYIVHCSVLWNRPQSYYDQSDWLGRKELEGGPLYTQCSHFIDLLIYMFGDIQRVNSIGETKTHSIEVEDCGVAILKFKSGVMGTLSYTNCEYNKNYEGSITIVGEKGTIKIGGSYLNTIDFWDVQSYPLPHDIDYNDKPNNYAKYKGTSSNHDKVIADVVADFLDGKKSVAGWQDGHKVVEAIRMIYRSQERNGERITISQLPSMSR